MLHDFYTPHYIIMILCKNEQGNKMIDHVKASMLIVSLGLSIKKVFVSLSLFRQISLSRGISSTTFYWVVFNCFLVITLSAQVSPICIFMISLHIFAGTVDSRYLEFQGTH